jgi:hypothetical protein
MEAIPMLREARQRGVKITADMLPLSQPLGRAN